MVAIGTDLLDSRRIEAALMRHGQRFIARILTPNEQQIFQQRNGSINFLAKQFAAKEALAKALGTGIAKGVGFQQIEILRDEKGAPVVHLFGAAQTGLEALNARQALVSLSDESHLILAFAALV